MSTSKVRSFLAGAGGALLVLIAAAVIVPQYADYTARAKGSEALNSIRPVLEKIEIRAFEGRTLSGSGEGISISTDHNPSSSLAEKMVLADGIVIFRSEPFGQVFVLIPTLSEDYQVTWRCLAGSHKDVPRKCSERKG